MDKKEPNSGPRITEITKNAWNETIQDMHAIAETLQEDGWDTVLRVIAGDTQFESAESNDAPQHGLVHVVPRTEGKKLAEQFEKGTFPEYTVFRSEVDNQLFFVTQFLDPDRNTAILVASTLERGTVENFKEIDIGDNKIATKFRKLDGEEIGAVVHDDASLFLD